MKWFLKTTNGTQHEFSSREELQDAILDLFSEDGMNPIDEIWTEEDGKRTELVTRWSVDVRPLSCWTNKG
jgi:hypothetical protein